LRKELSLGHTDVGVRGDQVLFGPANIGTALDNRRWKAGWNFRWKCLLNDRNTARARMISTESPLGGWMSDEWIKTLADRRRVKFTNQELDDKAFLTAQVEGNKVVYSIVLNDVKNPLSREEVETHFEGELSKPSPKPNWASRASRQRLSRDLSIRPRFL
jgi:hypothetical protein